MKKNLTEYKKLKEKTAKNEMNQAKTNLSLNRRGLLLHKGILYVPNLEDIKLFIMDEIHKIPYSLHPRYQKMITMTQMDFF